MHAIMESRRRGTTLLSRALASVRAKPQVLVAASGVGFYGSRGDELLTEDAPRGAGFLADVADVWEASTMPAAAAGVRVVNARFGVILSASGGALGACVRARARGGGDGGMRAAGVPSPRRRWRRRRQWRRWSANGGLPAARTAARRAAETGGA